MRKYLIACLCLAMAACSTAPPVSSIPLAPVEVADQTIVDEKAVIAIETGYKAFRTAVEVAVDAGLIVGELAARIGEIDDKINSAVIRVEQAYRAANADSYEKAVLEAKSLIEEGIALMRSK